MAAEAPTGTIVTRIRQPSCSIDSTRLGWPNSSLIPVFNRNGGPSAAAALDAVTDQGAGMPAPPSKPAEVAEIIGQEILPLGDGLQRGQRMQPLASTGEIADPAAIDKSAKRPPNQDEDPAVTVEVLAIPTRGGRRRKIEPYPFSTIKVARNVDGGLEGESFFIPDCEHPRRHIAVARKRYGPGKTFETRTVPGGVRVWRKS